MQHSYDKNILGWSQVFKLCDEEELPRCVKVPYKATSNTVKVNLLLLFQLLIAVGYRCG